MKKKYDIGVIGSGPGGMSAALKAASLGKKVAVIEQGELGGVCLNTGCIPTKTVIASVSMFKKISKAGDLGIRTEASKIDWRSVLERKRRVVEKLRKGVELSFKKAGIDVIKARAEILGPGAIKAGSDEILCRDMIIATGSEKHVPESFSGAMTSDEALELENPPSSMAVVGGGAVGIEFASIFSALGTTVTIYEMLPSILPGADSDISAEAARGLERSGIKVLAGAPADPEKIDAATVLVTGRKFTKTSVGPDMRTSQKGIYAVGDITGMANYAHTATMQGIIAAENICGKNSLMDYSAVPFCVFSDPEIAGVGITQQQAAEKNIDTVISKFPFAALGRSACEGDIRGFVKLIAEKNTGTIIGCHIIGRNAGELIQEAVIAVRNKMTVSDLAGMIHAHPTLPEALWEAARSI